MPDKENLESDGYYHICLDCNYRFDYITDYCADCGGENIDEDGVIEEY